MVSPKLAEWQRRCLEDIQKRVPAAADVSWVLSSGTSSAGRVKCIGLPHEAFFASARAVNTHLAADSGDRWLVAIPLYHVGGFSILVRASLSKSAVFHLGDWSAESFFAAVVRDRITLCSLVPTQVFDLVVAGLRCPPGLRAIVVGGGSLDEPLYRRARLLGWPVLTSYGLTESASQVATASLESLASVEYPAMTVLSHAEIELREQRIFIRGASLCRWVAVSDGTSFTLEDPVREGWLATEDLGELDRFGLRVLGRRDDVVKVLGLLVSTAQVASDVAEFAGLGCVLALPSAREGHRLVFVSEIGGSEGSSNATGQLRATVQAIDEYNHQAMGPFRIDQVCWVRQIPRGDLGKVKKAELMTQLQLT